MKPKFSVVTITYNAAAVLQPTLDSVLWQDYQHVEHLIIDGASTDETLHMARLYREVSDEQASAHEVVVSSEPDRGIYDAMNKGLQRATGDFVVFLNAGDTLPSPGTLTLVAEHCEPDTAVLYGDTDIVGADRSFLRHRRLAPPDHLSWRSFRQGMLVCHQAFYARADLAKATPYDLGYRLSADVDWCIRIMKEAERRHLALTRVRAVVANYLEEGATTHNHRASLRERFGVMRRHYGLAVTLAMHLWFVVRNVIKR